MTALTTHPDMTDTHPTIESLCAQIDRIGAKAMSLIRELRAERDELRVENERLRGLLLAADCPNARSIGHEQAWQCQWCDERKRATGT